MVIFNDPLPCDDPTDPNCEPPEPCDANADPDCEEPPLPCEDPMDPDLAGRYRREVLAPGGARDAAEMVRSFLGRDYELAAWEAWLRR